MKPKVSKRERNLQISYELPHRVHCAKSYPIVARNGSNVVIYGHTSGLRILWRGGRRRKPRQAFQAPSTRPNGSAQPEIITLDDDDDEPQPPARSLKETEEAQSDVEEEEEDPDCSFPSIVQDLDIDIGTAVLHVAVPSLQSSAGLPDILRDVAVLTFAAADGTIRMLQIPLAPPVDEEKKAYIARIGKSQIRLSHLDGVPSQLCMKLHVSDTTESTTLSRRGVDTATQFLVASVTRALNIWILPLAQGEIKAANEPSLTTETLPASTTRLAFHPALRQSKLLLADSSGAVRIYDPLAPKPTPGRPSSSDSRSDAPSSTELGKWIMTFYTSFDGTKQPATSPALAHRKKVLDACWTLNGKAILALLDDGEWGVWNFNGAAAQNTDAAVFALRGYLGILASAEVSLSAESRKSSSKLAPMTPNTRKTKSETLFTGAPRSSGIAARGGVTTAHVNARPGHPDESIVLWYDSNVYSIGSMRSFWQRTSSHASGLGTMHAPGLSHMNGVNLMSENITSVSQLGGRSPSTDSTAMNTQCDLLIATDYRIIFLQALRPQTPGRSLFQTTTQSSSQDQAMLDVGGLDLGGMDRMLDSMAAGSVLGRTRRVGFAA